MYSNYSARGRTNRPLPVCTIALVIINIAVFVYLEVIGDTSSGSFMLRHGANFWPLVFEQGEYYRLLTCTFIHFGISHIFNNMLVLGYIGDNLERALGHVRFVILYLVSGVGSSYVSAWISRMNGEASISGGASGAIFGVVGALLIIVIMNRGRYEDLSSTRLMLFIALSIYHGVTSAGIDNTAHVAGAVIGAVLGTLLYSAVRKKRRRA
ncbi:MAG: rhomboid family intramembrane serine protease [Lachnospiraceae bacterium]|nr:rhomboid family intramembrane serine protease [Lachnospiraceae bacterium]